MTITEVFLPIGKVAENEDGTLSVFGKATGPDLDSDRQICDPEWLAEAIPDWFTTGANVREMHGKVAAGVGEELAQEDDGWWLRSLVVDPVSCLKVRTGVLRGYSIGIAGAKLLTDVTAPSGRIVGGDIYEVSLVDRPANPTCTLTLAKVNDGTVVQVEDLTVTDAAGAIVKDDMAGSTETGTDENGGQDATYANLPVVDPPDDAAEDTIIGQARTAIGMAEQAFTDLLAGEVAELATGGGLTPIRVALHLLEDIAAVLSDLTWFDQVDADDDARQIADELHGKAVGMNDERITRLVADAVAATIAKTDAAKAATPTEDQDMVKALRAEVADLRSDLAKVLESPAPGGPAVAAAPTIDKSTATEAARYRAEADRVGPLNPKLAEGYRIKAARLEAVA